MHVHVHTQMQVDSIILLSAVSLLTRCLLGSREKGAVEQRSVLAAEDS